MGILHEQSQSLDDYEWKKVGALPPFSIPGAKREGDADTANAEPTPNAGDIGYEEGLAQGLEEGRAQGAAEQQATIQLLQDMLAETQRLRERTAEEGLSDAVTALQSLFSCLFQHELRTSPALIEAMIRELGERMQADSKPTLLLSTADYSQVKSLLEEHLADYVDVDAALPSGVVRATTGQTMLELDIQQNIQQVLAQAEQTVDASVLMEEPISDNDERSE